MKKTFLFFSLQLFAFAVLSQDSVTSKPFVQQDIKDYFIQKGWVKPKPPKQSFFLIIPVIASNPSAGFIFGAGLTYAFKAPSAIERISTVSSNATYSTKKQLNLNIKSNLFTMKDKLVLNGDWRYMIFTESTFGLGTESRTCDSTGFDIGLNGYNTSEENCAQVLRFDHIRFHETGSFTVYKNVFAGIGLHYDQHLNIDDRYAEEVSPDSSYHYQYSIKNGFDPRKYKSVGFSLNFLLDSRDNQVYAHKGYYANINYRINLTAFGSSRPSNILYTEYRSFHSLGHSKRHEIAFWAIGNIVTSGEVPYLDLPALGYDQRQKSGRGYAFGRFRGEGLLYFESEYRAPISKSTGILGGVLFANLTSTSDKANDVRLTERFRGGYGAGLRIMLDKSTRTRLQIDAGIADRQLAFYFGAQETF